MLHAMATNETCDFWTSIRSDPYGIALSVILFISLSCNILWCVLKFCTGKGRHCLRRRRRKSTRHMEDNPIYGNMSYVQADAVYTRADPPRSSLASKSLTTPQRQQRLSDTQSKNQDCYANLTLKAPRVQSGCSSPQILYSDVVHLEEPTAPEQEDEGITDAVSTMSDLYASVQTQQTKTVQPAEDGEDYANHL